jgi:hypothetical protein
LLVPTGPAMSVGYDRGPVDRAAVMQVSGPGSVTTSGGSPVERVLFALVANRAIDQPRSWPPPTGPATTPVLIVAVHAWSRRGHGVVFACSSRAQRCWRCGRRVVTMCPSSWSFRGRPPLAGVVVCDSFLPKQPEQRSGQRISAVQ